MEEDANTLGSDTMRFLQESLAKLNHAPSASFQQTSVTPVEHPLIVGVLQWILTSPHKRECRHYPTRSLTAWSIALILSHLGFEISASYRIISTSDLYTTYVSPSNTSHNAEVFLITCNYGETDPLESMPTNVNSDGGLKPRILPITAIPWVLFRHLDSGHGPYSTAHLSDVWNFSFEHALSALGTPTVTPDGTVQLPILRDDEITDSHHKEMLALWNSQLWKILGAPMQRFVPTIDGILNDIRKFSDEVFSSTRDDAILLGGQGAIAWHCMSAIVLATIYAVICKSLHTTPGPDQRVEIALPPDLLFSRIPNQWAVCVGAAINSVASCVEWAKMVLEVCTSIEFPPEANTYHHVGEYPPRAPSLFTHVFGAQANGVVVVADFLLNPSLNSASLATYHIAYGQSLHLPHDDNGFITASVTNGQTYMIPLNPEPEHALLESGRSDVTVRLDVAPDWDRDSRTVVFQARVGGIHRYTCSPLSVAQRLAVAVVGCQCSRRMSSLEVPLHERWQPVTMSQLFQPMFRTSSPNSRLGVEVGNYVCIQADGDVPSQLLCLGVMEGQTVALATECVDCAYRKLFLTALGPYKPREAILITTLM